MDYSDISDITQQLNELKKRLFTDDDSDHLSAIDSIVDNLGDDESMAFKDERLHEVGDNVTDFEIAEVIDNLMNHFELMAY